MAQLWRFMSTRPNFAASSRNTLSGHGLPNCTGEATAGNPMGLLHHRYYSKAAEPEPWRPPPYREIQKQIGMILREQYAPPKELPHQLLALVIEADKQKHN